MQIRKWVGQPIGLVNPCDGLTNPWTQLEKSAYCSPSPFCDALLRAIWPRWPHRRRGRRLRSPVMAISLAGLIAKMVPRPGMPTDAGSRSRSPTVEPEAPPEPDTHQLSTDCAQGHRMHHVALTATPASRG